MTTPKAIFAVLALIAVLVLLPCMSTAQQEIEEPPAALEQSQGTAIEAPAAQPLSAAPVQSERPAEPACDARCQAAEQREKSDLKAQQSMADAAFDLVVISRWQFGAGTIGITLLLTTLWYTRKSTRAAIDAAKAAEAAVEVTTDTAKHQLRAYVVQEIIIWTPLEQPKTKTINGYNLTIRWKNCGATPARRCRTRFNIGYFENGIPKDFGYPDPLAGKVIPVTEKSHIGPNGTVDNTVGITVAETQAAQRGKTKIFAWGWTEYDDIFEGTPRRRTEVCFEAIIGPDGRSCAPMIIGPFNGADDDCYHKPKT